MEEGVRRGFGGLPDSVVEIFERQLVFCQYYLILLSHCTET